MIYWQIAAIGQYLLIGLYFLRVMNTKKEDWYDLRLVFVSLFWIIMLPIGWVQQKIEDEKEKIRKEAKGEDT